MNLEYNNPKTWKYSLNKERVEELAKEYNIANYQINWLFQLSKGRYNLLIEHLNNKRRNNIIGISGDYNDFNKITLSL